MPETELAEVRARLEYVIFLAGAATSGPWTQKNSADIVTGSDARWKVNVAWGVTADAAFIAAASPDLLLRLANRDLAVMNMHGDVGGICQTCQVVYPCADVGALVKVWIR